MGSPSSRGPSKTRRLRVIRRFSVRVLRLRVSSASVPELGGDSPVPVSSSSASVLELGGDSPVPGSSSSALVPELPELKVPLKVPLKDTAAALPVENPEVAHPQNTDKIKVEVASTGQGQDQSLGGASTGQGKVKVQVAHPQDKVRVKPTTTQPDYSAFR